MGLNMAMDETAICAIDDHGAVHLEAAVMTDPEALLEILNLSSGECAASATRRARCRRERVPRWGACNIGGLASCSAIRQEGHLLVHSDALIDEKLVQAALRFFVV
ncbi:hypothetical protein ACWGTI_32515, partial [Mesorhizobium sp. ArgA1]